MIEKRYIKSIIRHGGGSHRDDALAVMIVLAIAENQPPVIQGEPSKEELNDPDVWVLDVGMDHNPELNNYDHHQSKDMPCAFHLVMQSLGCHELAGHLFKWYDTINMFDTKGPYVVARELGIEHETMLKLGDPIGNFFLSMFGLERVMNAGEPLYDTMKVMGKRILNYMERVRPRLEQLQSEAQIIQVGRFKAIVHDFKQEPALAMNEFRDMVNDGTLFLSITPDDRGDGWMIYRYEDQKYIDLSLLKDDSEIEFAHDGGFIAKTKEMIPLEDVINLTSTCVFSPLS